jgi:hypothetical protein
MCDHFGSCAPGFLLLPRFSSLLVMPHLSPAHQKISKCNSPNEIKIKVKLSKFLRFKFKPRQANDSSQSNQGSDHLVSQYELVSVPCKSGTHAYWSQVKTMHRACHHALPRPLQLRTLPRCRGELLRCHVSHGFRPRFPVVTPPSRK